MTLTWIKSLRPKLVSCSLMRFINCCCILLAMIFSNVAFSMAQSSASGEMTLTVAVRGSWKSKARSPMYEFLAMLRTLFSSPFWLMKTSSSPCAITKNEVPGSPCLMTVSPLAYFIVTNDSTIFFVCSSDICLKMCTFFASSILRVKSEASSSLLAMETPRPFNADARPSRVSIANRAPLGPDVRLLVSVAVLCSSASSSSQSRRPRLISLSLFLPDKEPCSTTTNRAPTSTWASGAMSLTTTHFMSSARWAAVN
mmetsp:Transcript_105608/g.251760  ORF Transcript_105608/g.251760 Transcript_105608/m.251760 type:complete len:255 (+) Transcript_105608:1163-1927(+)